MINGSQNHRIDFKKFESPNFVPYLMDNRGWESCGSACLSTVCGIPAKKIEKHLPKNQRHWSNQALSNFLKKKGYKVAQVTKNAVRKTYFEDSPLNSNHVLICNNVVDRWDASYFLVFQNIVYHNFLVWPTDLLFFVNKIPQNIFIVHHRKWA